MKIMLHVLILIIILSCKEEPHIKTPEEQKRYDSIYKAIKKESDDHMVSLLTDTTGVWESPIQVLSYKITKDEYASFKQVELTVKNISDKNVDAVRFKWFGFDAFGDPATGMGHPFEDGYGGGYSDETIKPGNVETYTWRTTSTNLKKLKNAWPVEVVYEDGSKWELKN